MYAHAEIKEVHLNDFSTFIDCGPEEVDLTEYIDYDVMKEICKNCRVRRTERRPVRAHFRRLI